MLKTIFYNIVSINLVYSLANVQENEMGKLIFANVLFRHGDRTPIDPYPNDPYKNASFWPVGFGQLTNTGKEQQYELGQWLRKRYDSLLTDKYSKEILHVQSTDVDRTLMSAESNLAGLYPPGSTQKWHPRLNWQPIPVHTIPEKMDKVLAAKHPCPAYDEEHERVLHSPEIQQLNKKFSNVYKVLNENTGANITKLLDINDVFNNLYIENLYNYTLPAWTKEVFPQPMEEAAKYSFLLPTWTPKLARLKSGLLVKDMLSHMKHKMEGKLKPDLRLWMYSAHDNTVACLLHTLGVFDLQIPPYASAVLMELRQTTAGQHQVTLFYRNSTQEEPYLLTLPGCSPVCPLDQFLQLCEHVIPQDWDRECQSLPITISLLHHTTTVSALVISALLLLLLVFSAVLFWQRRKTRPTHCQGYKQFFVVPWDRNNVSSKLLQGPNAVFGLQL